MIKRARSFKYDEDQDYQISKIEGCALKRVGTMKKKMRDGQCASTSTAIYSCFDSYYECLMVSTFENQQKLYFKFFRPKAPLMISFQLASRTIIMTLLTFQHRQVSQIITFLKLFKIYYSPSVLLM